MAKNQNSEFVLDYDFLMELLKGCLQDKEFLNTVVTHCKSTYIPEGAVEIVFKEISQQYRLEDKKPTIGTLKLALRKQRKAAEIVEELKDMDKVDIDQMTSKLSEFIKQAMFIETYNEVGKEFNKGNNQQAYKIFAKQGQAALEFTLHNERFTRVIGDFDKRQVERITGDDDEIFKVRTMIDGLDKMSRGGFETKQFVLAMAGSKGTKSIWLIHLGVSAMRQGYAVAHFQIEGTKKEVLQRYDSAWTGTLYSQVGTGDLNASEKKLKKIARVIDSVGKEDIYVHAAENFGTMNMDEIYRIVYELKKKVDIKVVIIDYLDLINPDAGYYSPSDERFRQTKTAQKMKAMAMDLNVLVASVTQSTIVDDDLRNDPQFVITRNHLAEDKGKVRPVDVLMSFNRTDDEEENGTLRIHIDAARDYKRIKTLTIKQNLRRMRFYDRKGTIDEIFADEMPDE